jgi:hypothetical protein
MVSSLCCMRRTPKYYKTLPRVLPRLRSDNSLFLAASGLDYRAGLISSKIPQPLPHTGTKAAYLNFVLYFHYSLCPPRA